MPVLITAGLSPEAYKLKRILDEAGNGRRETGNERRETGIEKREARGEKGDAQVVVFADESALPMIPGTTNIVIPPSTSGSFVHEILKACLDLHITKVYPLKGAEVIELSKARSLFSEYNVTLIIPSDDWLENNRQVRNTSLDKLSIMEDGRDVAGEELPVNFPVENETGMFIWATKNEKIEYSLYLVNDARI